ncbi:MAG: hypothetical protein HYU30_09240 [Chloroflexi bacterium]|nr:hypothetical protein [Chloroflexota bacterium]
MTTKRSRLLEVDYDREDGVVIHVRPRALRLFPRESARHWRSANKEMLLAFRSLLDSVIERVDPEGDGQDAKAQDGASKRVVVTEEKA